MCTIACLAVIYVPFPIEMWYHVLEFCMTFWPFSPPIMSMWSFFISPRLTLIPFRMHFESCWYNLSYSGNFFCAFYVYTSEFNVFGWYWLPWKPLCRVICPQLNYDWGSPKPCDHFQLIPISDFKWEKSGEKSSERNLNWMFSSNLCTISDWNMVSGTEVWWLFNPPPPTSIAL